MTKYIIAAVAALTLSSSALADKMDPSTPVLLPDGLTTVGDAMRDGVSDEAIRAGIARADQQGIFQKGIADRETVKAIDAGELVHLTLLQTYQTDTGCRGADRYIAHVPGSYQPRCLVFTLFP